MKQTPLYDEHIRLGAKMVDFGGWLMPVQYTGIIGEHLAVRSHAGLFDVSHMGQIEFVGPDALECVENLTANKAANLQHGEAQYSLILNENGGVVDDIIVYRLNKDRFMFVVNAANIEKDFSWLISHSTGNVEVLNRSNDFALIAFQGPLGEARLQSLVDVNLKTLSTFKFAQAVFDKTESCIIARTGYTGEDGFEIFSSTFSAPLIWKKILATDEKIRPVGLGARDTLRLEMKYSLYGHEINDETNPFEAGLAWVVKLDKKDFIGKNSLIKIKMEGIKRKLIGFKMLARGIPRANCSIARDGKKIGHVTSGTMSPSLNFAIGIGYVESPFAAEGNKLSIDIRGELREAVIVKTPFYKH